MMQRLGVRVALTAGVWLLVLLSACSRSGDSQETEERIKAPQRVSTQNGVSVISLDLETQRRNGIETQKLSNTTQPVTLRAYGVVLELQTLSELGNNYANARAQENTARAKLEVSRAARARAQALYRDQQNMSAAQLQAAEAALQADQAALTAAQALRSTLEVTAQENWGAALARALMQDGPLLTRLKNREDVLVQITLRPGQSAAAPLSGALVELPGGARVPLHYISAATKTDPRIQGASFFLTAPASSGLLPGMGVAALVPATAAVRGVVVPLSAIVWAEGGSWAYFRTGASSFARRAIATELPALTGGYVVRGAPDDLEVVVQGAQMLLSEEFRAQAQVSD